MRNKFRPTRKKIREIELRCRTLRCNDSIGQANWNCKKCKLSNEYERMSGVRIEDLMIDNLSEI